MPLCNIIETNFLLFLILLQLHWQKFRIEIHSELIRFISIHSEICIHANPNSSDSIRKKFSVAFDVNRLKINSSQSQSIRYF